MNSAKFAAAQRLNELENSLNVINENIDKLQGVLDGAKATHARTKTLIAMQRQIIDAMPDGAA